MTFENLGLSKPLLDALISLKHHTATPIQQKTIPEALKGRDILAAAQTGTGKTASFALPLLEKLLSQEKAAANRVKALILTPTRELAVQVAKHIEEYAQNTKIRVALAYGGVKINPQMIKLRQGAEILVATPGRLLDLFGQNALKFDQVNYLVLDEADRMLDMGFIHDLTKIMQLLPKARQNLMFSATFSPSVTSLAKTMVKNPLEISVSPANTAAQTVSQWICPVDKKQKPALLCQLIIDHRWQQLIVFCKTRKGAGKLSRYLEEGGFKTATIHGDKTQPARLKAFEAFKSGQVQILVATDVAARGLDIKELPHVVNFDLPLVAEDYIHRIGRTGRAGKSGEAVSLVCADEFPLLCAIENLLKKQLARKIIDGFEPVHSLPASKGLQSIKKIKRPKKPKPAKFSFESGKTKGKSKNPSRTPPPPSAKKPGRGNPQKTRSPKKTKCLSQGYLSFCKKNLA